MFLLFITNNTVTALVDSVIRIKANGWTYYKYYIGRYVQVLQVDMLILLEVWLCLELWNQFKALNGHLSLYIKGVYSSTNECNTIKDLDYSTTECIILNIGKVRRLHNLLCDIVETFDEVFGASMLLETITVMSLIVQHTLRFVILFDYRNRVNYAVITMMTNGFLFIVQSVLVYGEAHTTIAISFRSINELETTDLPGLYSIKRELLDLIQQVHIRNPKVIASSFFDVNFSMAGFATASVTSYIIVALQFMIQEK
nr:unnamed protein product [Callosobruchus analis]